MDERVPCCSYITYPDISKPSTTTKSYTTKVFLNYKRPQRQYYKMHQYTSRPKFFLKIRLLWMYVPLMLLLLISSAMAQQLKYTNEERQIVRGLFLQKFGLQALIDPIQNNRKRREITSTKLPAYIWDLYESVETREHDNIRHYLPSKIRQKHRSFYNRLDHSEAWILSYNLSATGRIPEQEFVYRSDLRIPISRFFSSSNILNLKKINLYSMNGTKKELNLIDIKTSENLFRNPGNKTITKLSKKIIKWLNFDVSNVLNNDKADKIDFLIEVQFYSKPEKTRRNLIKDLRKSASLIVYIEDLEANSNVKKRVKREIQKTHQRRHHRKHRKHNSSGSKDSSQCRRTEMYVDFAELNWQDWIMAPVGYDAYQCRGKCPHPIPSQMNTTNHAIIQSLINSIDPSAVSPPCCVPVEMSAISILYRDIHNVVVVKTYPDMRVEACGCH